MTAVTMHRQKLHMEEPAAQPRAPYVMPELDFEVVDSDELP